MDLRAAIIFALIHMTAGNNETTTATMTTSSTTNNTSSAILPTSTSSSSAPVLGFLTVSKWTSKCEGSIYLTYARFNQSPVCYSQHTAVQAILQNVCHNNKGCNGPPQWRKGSEMQGYNITEGEEMKTIICPTLTVKCKDVQGQLKTYKVVTALLCCVLLVIILVRFTRPTVKALQKRLSSRRQNRWVGPTQSHSVSYHRGKSTVKNSDGEKRLSYPALERLTISDSREPSSNRNSGYNF
ncbi:uncharacterized protein LOC114436410 isoform X2 [Parambassis ranga]|uniref:Uncharacterized protein LOC114436410 isoform X2 n=1 Tax=Parambassis ranga TaxID=210632 RepID=A0A6P7I3E9_9TELE|nr:uncharacterized protein LOC114436410 isoform X2 [Parambassis ranga]